MTKKLSKLHSFDR